MKGFLLILSYHKEDIRLFLRTVGVIAIFYLLMHFAPQWEQKKIEGWPTVEASVVDRTIVEGPTRGSRTITTNVIADLTLSYDYDGESFRQHLLLQNVHRNRLSFFENVKSIKVRVSPQTPDTPAFRYLDQDFTGPTSSIAQHQ